MARRTPAGTVGARIKRYREEKGLSLSALAANADMSKSYLHKLENDATDHRPSAETLYALAQSLGVTMSDLLGRQLLTSARREVSKALADFAAEEKLPQADVQMLASIEFRGEVPKTKERWRYIYQAIKTSSSLDPSPRQRSRRSVG
jgi:transcriptional regulator with XRE-family HTH domain